MKRELEDVALASTKHLKEVKNVSSDVKSLDVPPPILSDKQVRTTRMKVYRVKCHDNS